jgi:hypothetical protein
MSVAFSERPGRHERHYRRCIDNPLFGDGAKTRNDSDLLDMQRLDHEELLVFLNDLRATVQRAIQLQPNEGSEVILEIKEHLDRLYEQSAGLADDHRGNQSAIAELLEVVMRNVERSAAGDPQAIDELAQERAARAAHFELLAFPLVADLLHPQSVIGATDLAPVLLSAGEEELAAALSLFDAEQLAALYEDAQQCLAICESRPPSAVQRLEQIAARSVSMRQQHSQN